jgi:hypothetical protein
MVLVKGSDSEAITERQKAIELEPTSAGAYIDLDDLYKAKGRTEAPISLCRVAPRGTPLLSGLTLNW